MKKEPRPSNGEEAVNSDSEMSGDTPASITLFLMAGQERRAEGRSAIPSIKLVASIQTLSCVRFYNTDLLSQFKRVNFSNSKR
jgi:hypothetical protein